MKKVIAVPLLIAFVIAFVVPSVAVDHCPPKKELPFVKAEAQFQMTQKHFSFSINKLDALSEVILVIPDVVQEPSYFASAIIDGINRTADEINKGPPNARSGT